jgi:hypothetical protein
LNTPAGFFRCHGRGIPEGYFFEIFRANGSFLPRHLDPVEIQLSDINPPCFKSGMFAAPALPVVHGLFFFFKIGTLPGSQ